MPVPDFQSLMLPVLRATSNGVISAPELRRVVAEAQGLNEKDLEELLPSGRQTVFANRVAWANIFLQRAGLIDKVRRGHYVITKAGRAVLSEGPARIDMAFLNQYPSYREWREASTNQAGASETESVQSPEISLERSAITPEELIEASHKALNVQLAADLLDRLREISPSLFERLMIDLLLAMKYGGGRAERAEMAEALGRSGDGGLDGVIKEDELGLDAVYVQAKRYGATSSVGEPEIRDFVGALVGRRATKGVFITTSTFTRAARDGNRLANLMVHHGVGVRVRGIYEVKAIDEEFFDE
jgi:restriction system protein